MIFMIAVGGLTRLTNSGLSMVDWKPLSIVPPLSESDWQVEFDRYQQVGDYKKSQEIKEFKRIYYYEYFHRILGRFIFIYFFFPFLYLAFSTRISIKEGMLLVSLVTLIILQGIIGWFMVKSGLIDIPSVSHFRLMMHLVTALLLLSFTYILYMHSVNFIYKYDLFITKNFSWIMLGVVIIQIIYGAFTAGLDAAKDYNTFPLMGGSLFPDELFNNSSIIYKVFSSPYVVQFFHRSFGMILFFIAIYLLIKSVLVKGIYFSRLLEGQLSIFILIQFILGIISLIAQPQNVIVIAIMHQVNASLILLFCITILYSLQTNSK